MKKINQDKSVALVLFSGFVFLCAWFGFYFTDRPLPGWDLPGHIALVDRLSQQLILGNVRFYDRFWFSGWAAYEFYAPLSHIVAALLSILFKLFYADSARAAVHYLLVISCALLPVSVYYFLNSFCQEKKADRKSLFVAAIAAVAMSFWFLNHDQQWFGIGAAAVMHIGLFSQAFAWHLLLLHAALLVRGKREAEKSWILQMTFVTATLFLTHSLTAVFSFVFAALYFIWCRELRKSIVVSHLLALGISAFWLFPFLAHSATYVGLDIHRPSGDILELFFRYPLLSFPKIVAEMFRGVAPQLDIAQCLVTILFFVMLFSKALRQNTALQIFLVTLLIASTVLSSDYIASSVALGLHYYRFHAYVFLLLSALLAALPVVLESTKLGKSRAIILDLLACAYLLVFLGPVLKPHYERKQVRDGYLGQDLAAQQQVLDYFSKLSGNPRVFIEYNTSERFAFLSAHYLASELGRRAEVETLNGLFIQSSLAYRMPVVSANLLGAKTFNIPLLFTDRAVLDNQTKLQQLLDFGTTHVIAGSQSFASQLSHLIEEDGISFGPYTIFDLQQQSKPHVAVVEKPIIGYIDVAKSLPFKFVEFYFYARQGLYQRYELIDLSGSKEIPNGISLLLVNCTSDSDFKALSAKLFDKSDVPVLRAAFREHYEMTHFKVRYQHNVELDSYDAAEAYFDNQFGLERKIDALSNLNTQDAGTSRAASLTWDASGQAFQVANVNAHTWYRVNYSYFPYWKIQNGSLFRGLGERMYFLCNQETCGFSYTMSSSVSWLLGMAVSLLCLTVCFSRYRQLS